MMELRYKLFFKAISNETRFQIIKLLRDGPGNVNEICRKLKFEQSRVSHNLKCLENCGFVLFEWQGKNKVYSLDKEFIIPILKNIDKHFEKYNERLIRCGVLANEEYSNKEEADNGKNQDLGPSGEIINIKNQEVLK